MAEHEKGRDRVYRRLRVRAKVRNGRGGTRTNDELDIFSHTRISLPSQHATAVCPHQHNERFVLHESDGRFGRLDCDEMPERSYRHRRIKGRCGGGTFGGLGGWEWSLNIQILSARGCVHLNEKLIIVI